MMRVGKNSGPVLSRLLTKVREIVGQRRRPFLLSNALIRLSMSRFFLQIFAIKSRSHGKTEQIQKFFGSQFFSVGTTPIFLRHIVSAIYHPPFGKVFLSSVCWSPSATPDNEVECRIYGGWVKTHFQFEAVCGPKFISFWSDVGDPLWFATQLMYIMFRSEDIGR